ATASARPAVGATSEQWAPGMREPLPAGECCPAAPGQATATPTAASLRDLADILELRQLMWGTCGITRTGPELAEALTRIDLMGEGATESRPLQLARTTARLVIEAALHREESRGAHHRGDFPTSIDRWRVPHVMRSQRGAHRDRDTATRR
ncbi:MAG: hypothetical protein ACRDYC_06005, partial [Acidimicrobiales bacterium]